MARSPANPARSINNSKSIGDPKNSEGDMLEHLNRPAKDINTNPTHVSLDEPKEKLPNNIQVYSVTGENTYVKRKMEFCNEVRQLIDIKKRRAHIGDDSRMYLHAHDKLFFDIPNFIRERTPRPNFRSREESDYPESSMLK